MHEEIITFAWLALGVDAVGIYLFSQFARLRTSAELASSPRPDRGHHANMHGVFLHAFVDAILQLGVIFGEVMMRWWSWQALHGYIGITVDFVCILCATPLFKQTAYVLLHVTPEHLQAKLDRCVRDISFYDGVLECRSAHWWMQAPGNTIGTLHIRLRADANEQDVTAHIHNLLRPHVSQLTVQIEKDEPMHLSLPSLSHADPGYSSAPMAGPASSLASPPFMPHYQFPGGQQQQQKPESHGHGHGMPTLHTFTFSSPQPPAASPFGPGPFSSPAPTGQTHDHSPFAFPFPSPSPATSDMKGVSSGSLASASASPGHGHGQDLASDPDPYWSAEHGHSHAPGASHGHWH